MKQLTIKDLLDHINKYNVPLDHPIAVTMDDSNEAFPAVSIGDDWSLTICGTNKMLEE